MVRKSTPDGSRELLLSYYYQRIPKRRTFAVGQSGQISFTDLIIHSRNLFYTRF